MYARKKKSTIVGTSSIDEVNCIRNELEGQRSWNSGIQNRESCRESGKFYGTFFLLVIMHNLRCFPVPNSFMIFQRGAYLQNGGYILVSRLQKSVQNCDTRRRLVQKSKVGKHLEYMYMFFFMRERIFITTSSFTPSLGVPSRLTVTPVGWAILSSGLV